MNTAACFPGKALLTLILLATATVGAAADQQSASPFGDWRTFTNRAGWSIKYPRNWRAQSCRQCEDLTDPNAFLVLSDPSTNEMIMIERLADKPENKVIEVWLHEVAKDTVLAPIRREEWMTLSGSKALKIINERSENIYAIHGSLTIAIRYDRPTRAVNQVISTFSFDHRK